jgi:hypothetical protein
LRLTGMWCQWCVTAICAKYRVGAAALAAEKTL